MKIVVFDLDETLGYFVEFGIFWDSLTLYLLKNNKNELNESAFIEIFDLYPEFIRPNIIEILNYLKIKKKSNCCHKLMIYTNNQGPKKWGNHVISYFQEKIKYKLFDKIIAAFKINGTKIEFCRTCHEKSYKDLMRCTKMPVNTEICFIDDNYFLEMNNKNIYYIKIKPYIYNLEFDEIINRFINNKIGKKYIIDELSFREFMNKNMKMYNFKITRKDEKDYENDKKLGKQIMYYIEDFFNNFNKKKTRKNLISKKNKTLKNVNKHNTN
jgi:hypothetical protein